MQLSLLQLSTFVAAFLLFQIELIIAKLFLPHYGGSYMVWGACVVFFQAVLLLGYVFAHFLIKHIGISRYRWIHLALMLTPLLFFPGKTLSIAVEQMQFPLAIDVFMRLLVTIGPVFFVLSTMSIVLQVWLSRSDLPEKNNPYELYAISNLGSFIGLLTYPCYFEMYLSTSAQVELWRWVYFALIGVNLLMFLKVKTTDITKKTLSTLNIASKMDRLRWLFYSASGVILFLSVNNLITYEIAPIPLLWVIPLSIYLLAYVLNFQERPWCPGWITKYPHLWIGFTAIGYFLLNINWFPTIVELIFLLVCLFALCMYAQRKLFLLKPMAADLTEYYVMISLGGFIGGVLTSWIIPLITTSANEILVGLLTLAIADIAVNKYKRFSPYILRLIIYLIIFITVWGAFFDVYNVWALILLFFATRTVLKTAVQYRYGMIILMALILGFSPIIENFMSAERVVHKSRNYYSTYRVADSKGMRRLLNGTTLHGSQILNPDLKAEPTTYYSRTSPIGRLLIDYPFKEKRIGAVGLGVGTISTYLQKDQQLDFYELDPDVLTLAHNHFDFLNNAAGQLNFLFGDARLSMIDLPDNIYDVLFIDAFGSDAIPFHLMTTDVVNIYKRLLTDNGVIIFHISNRYVDLTDVVGAIGVELNAYPLKLSHRTKERFAASSHWAAITWDKDLRQKLMDEYEWKAIYPADVEFDTAWTDDHNNVWPYVKLRPLVNGLKRFRPFYW